MIPALEKQTGLVEYRYNSECNLHGDDNNIEASTRKESARDESSPEENEYESAEAGSYKIIDGPIDLSSNTFKIEPQEMGECHSLVAVKIEDEDERKVQKLGRQKKRKMVDEDWNPKHITINERIPRTTVSKKEEVLKAARSLFSKRTRTLYHWMYPDTSKGQLKAIVSAAWDTLSTTEKEFYVSQVLGRFGVPAGSLMVNPQLGGFQNREFTLTPSISILNTPRESPSSSIPSIHHPESFEHKKRHRRHDHSKHPQSSPQEETVEETYDEDEFADDPELTTELMQFRRAMGNND